MRWCLGLRNLEPSRSKVLKVDLNWCLPLSLDGLSTAAPHQAKD